MQGLKAIGAIGIIILGGIKLLEMIKSDKSTSFEQKRKKITELNDSICHQIFEFSQTIQTLDKKNKKFYCFIGPTSVGKTTLCNQLFGLKLQTGLGPTTKKIQKIHEKNGKCYFDAPGKDNDWELFTEDDVKFFKQIDRCFLIYQGQVKEVQFIAKLLSKMKKQLIFVRNQCDRHDDSMKQITKVIKEDQKDLIKMGIIFQAVIPSGKNRRSAIQQWI